MNKAWLPSYCIQVCCKTEIQEGCEGSPKHKDLLHNGKTSTLLKINENQNEYKSLIHSDAITTIQYDILPRSLFGIKQKPGHVL